MPSEHKRTPKTVKLNTRERKVVARAAELEGMAPATWLRLYGVRAAVRRMRRHEQEQRQKQTAASDANR